ncbi:hypothetical protein F5884DRAFT_302889 [Xylogone sp. PMI_703]|nr:hypothetical protein F5884DRAFT_302889 [Xylogone sp. PMI_703]
MGAPDEKFLPPDIRIARPPPPYHDDEDVPQYERPPFHNKVAVDGSTSLQPAMSKFPPAITCYYSWKAPTTVYLGTEEQDRLYCVKLQKLFSRRPMTLYDGPSDSDPELASVDRLKGSKLTQSLVQIKPRSGHSAAGPIEIPMTGDYELKHTFAMAVRRDSTQECFEWRNTRGSEVKEISGSKWPSWVVGWKLVWVSGPQTVHFHSKKDRETGFTSDGKEIVAVAVHEERVKTGPKLAFMGTGLTGTLGETWEIMVVMSFLRIWELQRQHQATNSAAAAAAAAASTT